VILPYLVVFAITTAFVAIAGSSFNRSRLVRGLAGSAAIAIVSVFAGIRDFTVGGPDVRLYGNKIFSAMVATPDASGIFKYANDRNVSGEVGYYLLNWLVSRFTDDPHIYYTVLAAICASIIYAAIMLMRSFAPAAVMWLTYLLTAYVEGFNLLRQSPALALGVLTVALVVRSRFRLGFLAALASLLFHNSAFVVVGMWAIAMYLTTRKERISRSIWLVLIVSVLGLAAFAPILSLLGDSLSDTKYQEYLAEGARGGRAFGIDALYRVIPILGGVWVLHTTRPKDEVLARKMIRPAYPQSRGRVAVLNRPAIQIAAAPQSAKAVAARRATVVVLVLLTLELVLLPVREISYPFYRLLAYFGYLRIIAYALIVRQLVRGRAAGGLLAITFAAAYFWLIVISRNNALYSSAVLTSWGF
jgi:hypothetical protein